MEKISAIGKLSGQVKAINNALKRRMARLGSLVKKKVIINDITAPTR